MSFIIPNKKPLKEVASYQKSTNVSRSKRQSFLSSSRCECMRNRRFSSSVSFIITTITIIAILHRSWSPFKSLWVNTDVDSPRSVDFNDPRTPIHLRNTQSSKTKRASFLSAQDLKVNDVYTVDLCGFLI